MSIKKVLLAAIGAVAMLSTSAFALNTGWTAEGRVTEVYVGATGVYGAGAPAMMIFVLNNGTTANFFTFPLTATQAFPTTDIEARTMASQIYNAKTNGYWVQVHNDNKGSMFGYQMVGRILVQQ
jgi:uncharacterized protein YdbL (DUF1318 family)